MAFVRTTKKTTHGIIERRIMIILLFFFLAFGVLTARLFVLQIISHREYADVAARQHKRVQELGSERGLLFVQDKEGIRIPLALNRTQKTLIAAPKFAGDAQETIDALVRYLKLDRQMLEGVFSKKDDTYKVVEKKIEAEDAERIEHLKLPGIFFEEERRRMYPHGSFAVHLIGFVSKEEQHEEGRYGVERFYEKDLSGEKGFFEGIKDTEGFWIALGNRIVRPPKDGSDLVLTVDYNIQVKAEEILARVYEKWGSISGKVIVLEPATGKIRALAAVPEFDPNAFQKEKDFSVFLNPAVESMYELGSVLKPVTMAAGIQEGLVSPESTYEDPGEIKIGGFSIKNFDGKSYKTQTMTQVLEKSLNTGAVYAGRVLGRQRQYEYLKRFGFGERTGVDLSGEIPGNIANLQNGREIDYATASFGQGIAVTPLQLAAAIGAIANEGKLMRPFIIETVRDSSGNEIKKEPQLVREVVSKGTAEKLTKMLVSAVRNGFENRAGVTGYFVAGKTGTAQIPKKDGRGYSDKVIHTFVGYAPAFHPRFLILFQLDEPQGNRFAANTLTPAFHDLAEYILNYYEVPPDEK